MTFGSIGVGIDVGRGVAGSGARVGVARTGSRFHPSLGPSSFRPSLGRRTVSSRLDGGGTGDGVGSTLAGIGLMVGVGTRAAMIVGAGVAVGRGSGVGTEDAAGSIVAFGRVFTAVAIGVVWDLPGSLAGVSGRSATALLADV
jgi:hypothetical protein